MDRYYSFSCGVFVLVLLAAVPADAAQIAVTPNGTAYDLTLDPPFTTFHTTEATITKPRVTKSQDSYYFYW